MYDWRISRRAAHRLARDDPGVHRRPARAVRAAGRRGGARGPLRLRHGRHPAPRAPSSSSPWWCWPRDAPRLPAGNPLTSGLLLGGLVGGRPLRPHRHRRRPDDAPDPGRPTSPSWSWSCARPRPSPRCSLRVPDAARAGRGSGCSSSWRAWWPPDRAGHRPGRRGALADRRARRGRWAPSPSAVPPPRCCAPPSTTTPAGWSTSPTAPPAPRSAPGTARRSCTS